MGEQEVVSMREQPRYASLETAVKSLVANIGESEEAKMKAARDLAAIRDQELYRQVGCTSMAAFLPMLAEQLKGKGIGSASTIKRYLMLYDIYLYELGLEDQDVLEAISHLQILARLADWDRKAKELREPTKDGKVKPEQFESLARLVIWLQGLPSAEQTNEQLTAAATERSSVHQEAVQVYEELTHEKLTLPEGGWLVQNTQALVDKLTKAEDEEDEANAVERWWTGYLKNNDIVFIEEIQFIQDGEVVDRIPVHQQYTKSKFNTYRGKDNAKIEGDD